MGFELIINAIPTSGGLLEAVQQGDVSGELAAFVDYYFQTRSRLAGRWDGFDSGDHERRRFVDLLEHAIDEHPGIEHRRCDLDRRFEWLAGALRRSVPEPDRELVHASIFGTEPLASDARSVQGFPIKINGPEVCELIAVLLDGLDANDIGENCDLARLQREGAYKIATQTDETAVRNWIMKDFGRLKTFYREVNERSETALVIQD